MLSFERLKELKAEFEQMRKYNDRHYMSTITEDDVLEVLDAAIARRSATDTTVCPDCNGSGIYQEYDEYDRYYVHACYKCEGTGEIARQSATSEDNWKELREDFMHNLRGCDTVTVSLNGVGSTDYSTEDIHNMIASLTDNQPVAKLATSEDVAEAIEYYESHLTERLRDGKDEVTKRFDTAITALQAYQPWIPVGEKLPESGKHVLLCCEVRPSGKRYICDGFYAQSKTITTICDGDNNYEYDEETDEYYLTEGYYEVIKNWEDYSSIVIDDFVTHWCPLPEPPKGE